jgi:putative transposase
MLGVFRVNFPAGNRSGSMKASKFSDAQKAFILKQGDDAVLVAEICRKAGISQAGTSTGARSMEACCPTRCAD